MDELPATEFTFMLSAYGSSFGSMFIILDDFDERKSPDLTADAILATLRAKRFGSEVPDALVNVFPPPAVSGLGPHGRVQVHGRGPRRSGPGRTASAQTDNMVAKGNETTGLAGLFTVYETDSPQLFVDVDRAACLQQGISLTELFDAHAIVPGLALCQRLQPLRPDLASDRSGGPRLTRSVRT